MFPVLQNIIFTFIAPDGSYQPIHRLPPILAGYQYCFRLRGLYRINQQILKNELEEWRRFVICTAVQNVFISTEGFF